MRRLVVLSAICFAACAFAGGSFEWRTDLLPKLPQPVMNHATGTHGTALMVAGGRSVDATGQPISFDAVHVLEPSWTAWRTLGKLPSALMAAACASDASGFYLVGGFDGTQNIPNARRLRYEGGQVRIEELPPLPFAMSSGSAATYKGVLYVAGGITEGPQGVKSVQVLLSLRLSEPSNGWSATNQIPGRRRVGTTLVSAADGVYLLGGNAWVTDAGIAGLEYMNQCFRFSPGLGWTALPMPPSRYRRVPAIGYGPAHVLQLGTGGPSGDRNALMAYHAYTRTWARLGTLPDARDNAEAVLWDKKIVVPGGSYRVADMQTTIEDSVLTGAPVPRPNGFGFLDYAVVGVYFAAMIAMGAYFSRGETNTETFFLGGRSVPWWAVGLSIFGTSISSITYLAIPAKAYTGDWVNLIGNLMILLIVPLITFFYIPAFRRAPITTAYEYLETRFNLAIRIYGSIVFLLFQAGRIAIVLYLPALVLSASTGLSVEFSILTMGVITTIYTVIGGVEAVIWTDVVQSIVLIGGALLALVIAIAHIDDGFTGLATLAAAEGKTNWFIFTDDWSVAAIWVVVLGNTFAMFYPATADQTIVQRYLTTATAKEANRAVWTNALLTVPVSFLFFGLGTALWGYFKAHPEQLDPTMPNDAILPIFVMETFPVGLRSTLIAGVFAAAMSSLSASMNSLAAVAVNDYYKRFVPGLPDATALRAAKIITLLVGVAGTLGALIIAWTQATSLFDEWLRWLGLIGGGLAGIVALGVFTKHANGPGAVIGALASAAAVAWINTTTAHFFLYAVVGFLTAFVIGYLASLPFGIRPASKHLPRSNV